MYRRDTIIPFIQTDFPDPVVPATNKCGIDARSTTIGFPDMLFPSAIGSFISFLLKLLDEIISDKITESLLELGISIPIVFDYHHHKFCNGGLNEKEALSLSISTWNGIKPVVHYSESRSIEKNDKSIKPHAHSDYIYNYINTYSEPLDIMIEAKCKELAVLRYIEKYSLK